MQYGTNITAKEELMKEISVEKLFHQIKNPQEEFKKTLTRLRLVHNVDIKQYGILKRQLPYIVCGNFNPAYRKIENFGYTEYFMIDIDHIAEKELTLEALKARLTQDSRVVMCFISPSEDGLKLLFRFAEKCYDSGKYSLFYKLFLTAFSSQYGLQQVIDSRTSDVSRACFLSSDSGAYFNPNADPVRMEVFIDFDNPFEIKELQEELQSQQETEKEKKASPQEPRHADPDSDTLAFIKEKLMNKKKAVRQKPQIYIPEQLDEILEKLTEYIREAGVVIEEIVNISYGKKFKLRAGLSQAEVNLFFGKKGFSVVASSRQGTSSQLNELMTTYIQAFVSDYILMRENIALSYKPDEIKAEVPEHELIKQQAQLLFVEKNWREALQLYQISWENYPDRCNEWDGWRYAYCAQKLGDHTRCLDICRKVYLHYRDFKMIRNVYAWSIYYCEIKKEKITDENIFMKAGEGILKLSEQNDTYSPYTLTVLKVLDYLSEKQTYQADKIVEWTQKLNPALLDQRSFSFTDKEGNTRETASKQEQYYMLRTRALLEKGDWDECISLCEEALQVIDKFHYDNDVWFRWRIGLAYEGLGKFQESLDMQLELLKRKQEWFIQKEIAEQYYRLGNYKKSLEYALDSALNAGDIYKKKNVYILLSMLLKHLGYEEDAKKHTELVEKINQKEEIIKHLEFDFKRIWKDLKYHEREQQSGVIKSILPNGKAGFIKSGDGKTYYFRMRNFNAAPRKAVVGAGVSFYLENSYDSKKGKESLNAIEVTLND